MSERISAVACARCEEQATSAKLHACRGKSEKEPSERSAWNTTHLGTSEYAKCADSEIQQPNSKLQRAAAATAPAAGAAPAAGLAIRPRCDGADDGHDRACRSQDPLRLQG